MQPTRMPFSCVPCAKRKVRCDRVKPCSHCRRRRGDICEYPVAIGALRVDPGRFGMTSDQSGRIERLEEYIRSLGVDPNEVARGERIASANSKERIIPNEVSQLNSSVSAQITTRQPVESHSTATGRDLLSSEHARLVEHEDQTTYIEAPVWYSWSEAQRIATDSLEPLPGRDRLGYCSSLIDSMRYEDTASLLSSHPSPQNVSELWSRYLSHVHPMTKLFFDWDKEPLLKKAANAPQTLSVGEQAFVFAIYFITILSLSDEECEEVMGQSSQSQLLDNFQSSAETALLAAGFVATSDLLVLQAFLLYVLAMRNRARPATCFSLMGVAIRVAQRMGLHRDGSQLGLPPAEAEEKRRVWWQMQHMDIMISQILGCLSMTVYADWDAEPPANLEDEDVYPGMVTLPPDRVGLSGISHCLWRYDILYQQRLSKHPGSSQKSFSWVTSSQISNDKKDTFVEKYSQRLSEKFVQHCDLLNPLHISIQIGIRSFILAMKRVTHQPGVVNTKISQIPRDDREDLLNDSIKSMEYYVLGATTPLIAQFRWHNENYFQWTSFVYIIIEAHHRANMPEASSLWTLINKVCQLHPKLKAAPERADIVAITRLIVLAWHQRQEYLNGLDQQVDKPECVAKMEKDLDRVVRGPKVSETGVGWDSDRFMDLDFDMIDWSAWEKDGYVQALY
ncbi:fungal-specific transcription factor domain-containing protein [Xylariales sp. PMI_506]|nr:fungal-specific transcription factor domain-containing protein [Xylariales sp. PMI_506]